MKVLGIDEAGRGCVLGPLVVGAFLFDGVDDALRVLGVRDSKKISARKRTVILRDLPTLGTPDVRAISATAIDAGNLNHLEEAAVIDLITTHRPDHVILDALGHPSTLPALITRLQAALPDDVQPTFVVEPKADDTYPVCGAASIVAKTTRDAAIEAFKQTHGDFGSGYPSDPKTRAWLTDIVERGEAWPSFVRTRWGTIDAIKAGT